MPLKRVIQAELEERLKFEVLVSELSARFVDVSCEQVDAEILEAQRRICEHLRLDASALWQNETENSSMFVLTHLFRPPGGPPAPDRMDAKEYFPWCHGELLSGRVVVVSSLDKLPHEASRDAESWRYFGAKTSLTFPLSAGRTQMVGFLSFNDLLKERDWSDHLVKRLQLVAQIFANALVRKKLDETLRVSEELNRSSFAQAAVGIAHVATDGRLLRVNNKFCSLLGYSREEVLQLTFQEFTYPEDLESNLDDARRLLADEVNAFSVEKRYIRKDQSIVWANLTVSLLRTSTGQPRFFISVVEDITARKQVEDALRNLSGRLITAQEQERAWVAKELHDGICQHIAVLAFDLAQLKRSTADNPSISANLEKLSQRINELLEDVRRLSHGLHPSLLEHLGLTAALHGFCMNAEQSGNVKIQFTAVAMIEMLPKDVSLCLYRVAQEALQNVMKHSGATRATVELIGEQNGIHMRIADDGKGFDLQSVNLADAIGLVGMRERIGLVQGKMRLESSPGHGTVLDVHVPLLKSVR